MFYHILFEKYFLILNWNKIYQLEVVLYHKYFVLLTILKEKQFFVLTIQNYLENVSW